MTSTNSATVSKDALDIAIISRGIVDIAIISRQEFDEIRAGVIFTANT
jgi:hypothetical protein